MSDSILSEEMIKNITTEAQRAQSHPHPQKIFTTKDTKPHASSTPEGKTKERIKPQRHEGHEAQPHHHPGRKYYIK